MPDEVIETINAIAYLKRVASNSVLIVMVDIDHYMNQFYMVQDKLESVRADICTRDYDECGKILDKLGDFGKRFIASLNN